jgi:hypothetical protein
MIVYNLTCDNSHRFEGWFSSVEDFDSQSGNGQIFCPVCSSADVARQPSAPYVSTGTSSELPSPVVLAETIRRKFVEHIIQNTEDVGQQFPEEARRIHYKEAPLRSIRGQASQSEVSELREEGIEVHSIAGVTPPDKLH